MHQKFTVSPTIRAKLSSAAFCLIVGVAASAPAAAQVSITGAAFDNNSTADTVTGGTGIARSWHTANTFSAGALGISSQFQYQNSLAVDQPGGPNVALTSARTASYDIFLPYSIR